VKRIYIEEGERLVTIPTWMVPTPVNDKRLIKLLVKLDLAKAKLEEEDTDGQR